MINAQTKPRFAAKQQQGAALVVGLIFLVLLSLIGVASMQSTGLQERMAGNFRDQNQALQAAEAALRSAEREVTEAMSGGFGSTQTFTAASRAAWEGIPACPPLDAEGNLECAGLSDSNEAVECIRALPSTSVNVSNASASYSYLPVACAFGRGAEGADNFESQECIGDDELDLGSRCGGAECSLLIVGRGVSDNDESEALLQSLYCGPTINSLSI
jgi:Tfp pilus assembly protein PilX